MPSAPPHAAAFALAPLLRTADVATERILLPALLDVQPAALLRSPTTALSAVLDAVAALNPFVTSLWLALLLAAVQLALSIVTRSIAWNDRFWSVIPAFFAALYVAHAPLSSDAATRSRPDARVALVAALVLLWSARLTAHAARRGVYSPAFAGDYRYFWIRERLPLAWLSFRLIYASVVCVGFTLLLAVASAGPLHVAWTVRGAAPLNGTDALAAACALLALGVESVADRQQQRFQQLKRVQPKAPGARDGFCQTGLFALCRHPNFAAELAFWASVHMFSLAAGAPYLNWTAGAVLGYALVFQASTAVTERVSVAKYEGYAAYQQRVPRLWPLLVPRPPPPAAADKSKDD